METAIFVLKIIAGIFGVVGAFYVIVLIWQFTMGSRTRRRKERKGALATLRDFLFAVVFLTIGIAGYLNAVAIARMIPFLN